MNFWTACFTFVIPWCSGWSWSISCQGWWCGRNYFRCCLSMPNPQAFCWCLFSGQLHEVLKTCSVLINYELHTWKGANSVKWLRKSKGTRTSSRICKCVPSFCMVYAISKGGLSMVYSPGSESDNSSKILQVNESSNSELSSDKSSVSGKVSGISIALSG